METALIDTNKEISERSILHNGFSKTIVNRIPCYNLMGVGIK